MSATTALADPLAGLAPTSFQRAVLQVPEGVDLFLGGGRGGGKSYALAFAFLQHVETYQGAARMLYVRRTFAGMVDFEGVCRHVFGHAYGTAASYNAQTHLWRFPSGATLQLDQFDGPADFAKYQGKSFTEIAVDEAGQYHNPALLDLLRSCLRAPAPIQPRFMLVANPGGPGHAWLSRRHVYRADPWREYLDEVTGRAFVNAPSTFADNPNLDRDAYARQLDAATATDQDLGRAWKYGDWSIGRGAYFSTVLEESRNALSSEVWHLQSLPRPVQAVSAGLNDPVAAVWRKIRRIQGGDAWSLYLSHDHGVSAPSVTYVVGESPGAHGPDGRYYPRGSLVLLDELATVEPGTLDRGMGYTVPRLADEILAMCERWAMKAEGVGDDAMFSRTGSVLGTIAAEFRAAGVTLYPAKKGRRADGWSVMRTMLLDAGKPDRPGLYVSRRCRYFWETVPSLPRDPRDPDDVDSRAADHAADAARYALRRDRREVTVSSVRGLG